MDRTNAERQRRYRAKRKAAFADITSLRQKIAMLEQELAQATAKARRQQGLGIKALKAAPTKPNAGIVGSWDRNFELHEAFPPPPHRLVIPIWVPAEAQPAIEAKWEDTSLDKETRAVLERLATDGDMRRSVWEKLPPDKQGIAEIIPSAIEAFAMFALLRPPPQSKRREALQRYQHHLDKLWTLHPHPTGGLLTCATAATDLRYALESLRDVLHPIGNELWAHYWPGDDAMNSMDAAITFLAALQGCLIAIEREQQSDVRGFPSIARPDDPRARHRFFGQLMSRKMQEFGGGPRDDVVAALTRVAFNVDDVTTDTVRGWRRADRQIKT